MVFTTTLLLILIVILLNLAAIRLRDRIRKKYQTGAF
jgi:ABC-type phosphate transport system permease subunit